MLPHLVAMQVSTFLYAPHAASDEHVFTGNQVRYDASVGTHSDECSAEFVS